MSLLEFMVVLGWLGASMGLGLIFSLVAVGTLEIVDRMLTSRRARRRRKSEE